MQIRHRLLSVIALTLVLCCGSCRQDRTAAARAAGSHAMKSASTSTAAPVGEDDFFPIMTWEIQPQKRPFFDDPGHGLQSLSDCGYTVAGFVAPKQIKTCRRLGLRAIVAPKAGQVKWHDLSDEQIYQTVKQMIDEAGDDPAILGYFLRDEPGVQMFPALGKAVAAVKKLAPGKLAYINLYPNYATLGAPDLSQLGTASYREYLERFVSEVKPQFISYDNYTVQISQDLKEWERARRYYTNLLEVREVALKHDLPFWNIVSSNQIRPHTTVPSPANLLHQAYTTLAAGGQGLTWYTYYGMRYFYAPIDNEGNRTVTWSYLKMVNEQVQALGTIMRRLKSTGVYFAGLPDGANLPKLPGRLIEAIESQAPVMVGEFTGPDNALYAMVVNLGLNESARLTIKLREPGRTTRVVSPVDRALSSLEQPPDLWLAAGQGALLRLD